MASMYSAKLSQFQGSTAARDFTGRSSTQQKVASIASRCSGFNGARVSPQLPVRTVVTPCHTEDVHSLSQNGCAS